MDFYISAKYIQYCRPCLQYSIDPSSRSLNPEDRDRYFLVGGLQSPLFGPILCTVYCLV